MSYTSQTGQSVSANHNPSTSGAHQPDERIVFEPAAPKVNFITGKGVVPAAGQRLDSEKRELSAEEEDKFYKKVLG